MRYQLQPFNQSRFDACMAWVAKAFNRPISQYEAVKIHAVADALHVVEHHSPIIGGTFRKLKHGPVDVDALNRSKTWGDDPKAPMAFSVKKGNSLFFTSKTATSESMFTVSEQQAILDAARVVFGLTWEESQRFFHGECDTGPNRYLGKAWRATRRDNGEISWESILNAYAKETGRDVDGLKVLVCT